METSALRRTRNKKAEEKIHVKKSFSRFIWSQQRSNALKGLWSGGVYGTHGLFSGVRRPMTTRAGHEWLDKLVFRFKAAGVI